MLIILLSGVLLAFLLQQKIYERYWKKNLDVKVVFEQPYVYEGENTALIEEISNDKYLPLTAVEVRLGVSRNLSFQGEALDNSNVSDQSYRRDVFALFAHTKIIRRLPFTCTKRGYYQITRSEIVGSDFFFHREYYSQVEQQTQLYVYPKIVDVSRIRLICKAISGSIIKQSRLYPDPFEFSGIREYQRTDPMNHINWKASARMGNMMVNQFDSTTSVRLMILLDTKDDGIIKYTELTEEGIRIAASLAAELDKKHMDLEVKGNGICHMPEGKEQLSMYLKADTSKLPELNRKLAVLDVAESCVELQEILKTELEAQKMGHIYLVISKDEELAKSSILRQLSGNQNSVFWIMPYLRQLGKKVPQVQGITVLGWEVER